MYIRRCTESLAFLLFTRRTVIRPYPSPSTAPVHIQQPFARLITLAKMRSINGFGGLEKLRNVCSRLLLSIVYAACRHRYTGLSHAPSRHGSTRPLRDAL